MPALALDHQAVSSFMFGPATFLAPTSVLFEPTSVSSSVPQLCLFLHHPYLMVCQTCITCSSSINRTPALDNDGDDVDIANDRIREWGSRARPPLTPALSLTVSRRARRDCRSRYCSARSSAGPWKCSYRARTARHHSIRRCHGGDPGPTRSRP